MQLCTGFAEVLRESHFEPQSGFFFLNSIAGRRGRDECSCGRGSEESTSSLRFRASPHVQKRFVPSQKASFNLSLESEGRADATLLSDYSQTRHRRELRSATFLIARPPPHCNRAGNGIAGEQHSSTVQSSKSRHHVPKLGLDL